VWSLPYLITLTQIDSLISISLHTHHHLSLLEKAASTQGFKLRFQTVEQRDATSTSPPVFVVELSMTGDWWERDENGKSVCFENMTRKFQGLGVTNREARYNAAKAATVKLRQMMPGTQFPEGEFSEEWYEWINDNLGENRSSFLFQCFLILIILIIIIIIIIISMPNITRFSAPSIC
jgi:hypothetical protein